VLPFDAPMVRRAIAAYFGLTSFLDDNIGKILATLESTGLAATTRVLYSSDHGDNLGTRGLWGKSTMYEESAGIPMILAGPEVPQGNVCDVPVTLADAFHTLVTGAGAKLDAVDASLPGHSLIDIAQGYVPTRTILSEYHAAGAVTGAYMIRHSHYKYIHYAGLPPMLFDLARAIIKECEAALRKIVDPDAVDRLAKSDQAAKIAAVGGKDAILKRGTFRYSPPPGSKAAYY
jgi:choline-sulfatase